MPEQYKIVSPSLKAISPTQEAYIDYYLGEKEDLQNGNLQEPLLGLIFMKIKKIKKVVDAIKI